VHDLQCDKTCVELAQHKADTCRTQDKAWAGRARAEGAVEVDALAVRQALLLGKVLFVVDNGGRVYVKAILVACKGGIDHRAHVFDNLRERRSLLSA